MGKFNYARAQKTASRLIYNFGRKAILRVPGAKTGEDWKPSYAAPVDHPCDVVFLDVEAKLIDGSLIKYGDKKVYMAVKGLSVTPDPATQKIVVDSKEFTIIPPVKELNPAGTTVYWEFVVRS